MKTVAFALIAAAFVALAAPAHAQISENGGPVSYSADNLQYFDNEHRLVLTGNVDIVQNDARLQIGSRQTTIRPQNGQRVRGVFVPRHGAPQGNSGAN